MKTFRTNLSLSHGVSVNSNEQGTKYAEMKYSDAYKDRNSEKLAALKDKVLPKYGKELGTI